jgi:hypothetical protein
MIRYPTLSRIVDEHLWSYPVLTLLAFQQITPWLAPTAYVDRFPYYHALLRALPQPAWIALWIGLGCVSLSTLLVTACPFRRVTLLVVAVVWVSNAVLCWSTHVPNVNWGQSLIFALSALLNAIALQSGTAGTRHAA